MTEQKGKKKKAPAKAKEHDTLPAPANLDFLDADAPKAKKAKVNAGTTKPAEEPKAKKSKPPKPEPAPQAPEPAKAPPPAASAPVAAAPAPAPQQFPKTLAVSQEELLRMKLADMTIQKLKSDLAFVGLQRQALLEKIDPEGKLLEIEKNLKEKLNAVQGQAKQAEEIQRRIGARLGIDLRKYAFDEETGTLHFTG